MVAHEDVVALHAEPHVVLGARDRRRACAGEHHADLGEVLAHDVHRVEKRRAGDDRRAVLVVVEHGDRQRAPQRLLDVEAIGGADILEVDPAHCGLEQLAEADHVVGGLRADLEVEHVDVGERLEENPFAFHHGLAGERPDVAEPQDRRAVAHHRHQVALGRVRVSVIRPLRDLQTRLGHPGRVRQGEIALVLERLGGGNLNLPRPTLAVIIQGLLPATRHLGHKSFLRKGLS